MRSILAALITLLLISQPRATAVPAKGIHRIKLTAQTQSGEKVALYDQSHALLIGVSDYTHGWNDLENVNKELDEVQAVLETQRFNVVRVTNPTAIALKAAFEDFISRYGYHKGNRLLFYYSGHGHSDEYYGYLVPSDAPDPSENEAGFFHKALDMNQLMAWARRIRAKHVLFLFDSCFSGAVFKARNLPKQEERYIRRATSKAVRQFITAGSAGETVPAESTFTPAFVDALREGKGDLNKDGYVTGTELGVYLAQEVPNYEDQSPQYGKIKDYRLAQGDFVFFLQGRPGYLLSPGLVNAPPPPVEFLGHLQVNVTVPQSRVFVNDRLLGKASPGRPLNLPNLPTGRVKVKVTAKDYKPQTQWVTIHHLQWSQPVFKLNLQGPEDCWSWQEKGNVCTESATGMAFEWVPGGCFQMGRNRGETDERPSHEVCLDSFWMGKYEVTQGQWEKIAGSNPAYFKRGDTHPVENVSWYDIEDFIEKLNARGQGGFRLPTEAEWEYACRSGGKNQKYCGGSELDRVAWYAENSDGKTHPVGKKSANGLGLFDMSGNVWEWVADWYNKKYYYSSPRDNPKGPDRGAFRVNRGGSWYNVQAVVRAANRLYEEPGIHRKYVGFRLVRSSP